MTDSSKTKSGWTLTGVVLLVALIVIPACLGALLAWELSQNG